MTSPSVLGLQVPDFSAAVTGGGRFELSARRGRKLVLYFYPKDSTPGCTVEAQDFRDRHAQFAAAGADVFGISRDSLKSHESFKAKQGLPFELIADSDEAVCRLFDVIKMKNMYGKQVRGIERSTFLIDGAGRVAREWRGVKVAGHADEVLEAARAL
ncbi:MAG: peroxiredoxin [Burkholderiales bacterium]|nr:peroxiredoxin [Burkholderiales bacterium]